MSIKRGGNNIIVNIKQILITTHIINAVKEYNQNVDLSEFKISKGVQGY